MDANTQDRYHNTNDYEIDLKKLLGAILQHLWKILLITILCGAIAYFISYRFITPMYKTSATFYVNNKIAVNGGNTNISSNDLVTSINLVNSYIAVLNARDTLNDVINYADLDMSYGELSGMITASAIEDTEVFKVTVNCDDPEKAATIANSIAHIVTTKIANIIEGSSVKVVDYASVPEAPNSPSHTRNTAFGMLLGMVFSVVIVIILAIFDPKIKSEDDLKNCCTYPLLAMIPDMSAPNKQNYNSKYNNYHGYFSTSKNMAGNSENDGINFVGKNLNFATQEAYKLLRTKLQYALSSDKKCKIIVVSSAISGEGKSLSSINIAYSFAQLNKRVLLIDGDMRRPTLASKLSLPNYPGLSEYLSGFMGLDELLQNFSDDNDQNPVQILTAGNTPPNPVELINSEKMRQAFETLREKYDYILIDMPPVGDVSDALVAAKLVDGVLMIVRHDYSTRSAIRETVRQFEFIGCNILGVVLNCMNEKVSKYHIKKYNNRYSYHYAYANATGNTCAGKKKQNAVNKKL